MYIEQRKTKRFYPEGIAAHIILNPLDGCEMVFEGQVVDMSYGGIKIRLKEPFEHEVKEAELAITLLLPVSGVPVFIRGRIKHVVNQDEYGFKYAEKHTENALDDLMFECVKLAPPASGE